MIAGLVSLLALLPPWTPVGGNLARLGDVEITGPVRDLVLALGSAGESRLLGELLPGERVQIAVPLPLRNSAAALVPEIRWRGHRSPGGESPGDEFIDGNGAALGRARFLGWREDRAWASIESLPPGLRSRSRPPVGPPEIHLPRASLALLPACFLLGLALRRRAGASLALATLGSGVLLGLGWPRDGRIEREVTVFETDAESSSGLAVSATWERASASESELETSLIEASEGGTRIIWTGSLSGGGPGGGQWNAVARGSALFVVRPFEVGQRVFRREGNHARPLEETWLREEGEWTAHGPWPLNEPLPAARTGPAPPGWLVAGLPQGVPVLLGRAPVSPASDEAVWVRETGF